MWIVGQQLKIYVQCHEIFGSILATYLERRLKLQWLALAVTGNPQPMIESGFPVKTKLFKIVIQKAAFGLFVCRKLCMPVETFCPFFLFSLIKDM